MNKPLIFTAALMSAALVAGAAVDAEKICNRLFPETRIVEYRYLWGHEIEHIIREIKSDLDGQGF